MNELEKVKTIHDIDPGIMSNLTVSKRPVAYTISSITPDTFMSPAQPIAPISQKSFRLWDYRVGENLNYRPRATEPLSFQTLRNLADSLGLARLAIEAAKDRVETQAWRFKVRRAGILKADRAKLKKAEEQAAPDIQMLHNFFTFPDRVKPWGRWIRSIIEDLLVTDAVAIYPCRRNSGAPYSFEVIDGTTIKPLIDDMGRLPEPPSPAYQQILHGLPAVDLQRNELLYLPKNLRTHSVYGFSPIAQIAVVINIALRKEISSLMYFTEGNIPEALASCSPEWTPAQIAQYQLYWDDLMEGNLAQRRHLRFIPGGMDFHETRPAVLKTEFDDYLTRVIFYAFSQSPQALIRTENRSVAETALKQAVQEGLAPTLQYIKEIMDRIILQYFGLKTIEFSWEEEEEVDPEKQATIMDTKLKNGSMTLDEARDADGRDYYEGGLGAKPLLYTASGAVPLESVVNPPEPTAALAKAERMRERRRTFYSRGPAPRKERQWKTN